MFTYRMDETFNNVKIYFIFEVLKMAQDKQWIIKQETDENKDSVQNALALVFWL